MAKRREASHRSKQKAGKKSKKNAGKKSKKKTGKKKRQAGKSIFANRPVRLKPRYTTPDVNGPIHLYDGPVDILSGRTSERKPAEVSLVWRPFPRVELRVTDFFSAKLFDDGRDWRVSIPGRLVPLRVLWTGASLSGGAGASQPVTSGIIEECETFSGCRLKSVLFHVANGPRYIGTPVFKTSGTGASASRATAEAPPWRVTLDAVSEWERNDARQALRAADGYAITHVGRLERADRQPFGGKRGQKVLEAVGYLLSFCRGAWTHPTMLVGEVANASKPRQIWQCPSVDTYAVHPSWFNRFSCEGFLAFPGLLAKLTDSTWDEPIRHALHWYIVCNKPGPVSIEGAIVLQQAAFELLAWTLLVEEQKVLSEVGIRKLPASDQMRLLLSACDVPLAIPDSLAELRKVAKSLNWRDGSQATTEIRNAIVHASPRKRARILTKGADARTDAWTLGQWYLELVLLYLFGYTGSYSNRLHRGVSRGQEVEPVPWASVHGEQT